MNILTTVSITTALIGSALIGGVFFAFSSFIMKALARVPSAEGISVMQSINVVVLNPLFLGAFMGTAAISLLVIILAVIWWETPSAPWFFTGGLLYLVGTFLLTGLGNVPLNNQLAAVKTSDPSAARLWERYLDQWTRLNSMRTAASVCAALMFAIGLIQYES